MTLRGPILGSVVTLAASACAVEMPEHTSAVTEGELAPPENYADGVYVLHGVGHMCLDISPPPAPVDPGKTSAVGTPAPGDRVHLHTCDGSANQRIRIREVSARHEVELRAADLCITPIYGVVVARLPLELRACDGSDAQHWLLDGDSIRPARDVGLDVAPENGRGADQTALVLTERWLDDDELWTFEPTGDATGLLTSGFYRVDSEGALANAVASAHDNAVIEIDPSADLTITKPLAVNAAFTIRGGRRGVTKGAVLRYGGDVLFDVNAAGARITTVTMSGPSTSTEYTAEVRGIVVHLSAADSPVSMVDRVDMYGWTFAAVQVTAGIDDMTCSAAEPVRGALVTRSWLHANRMDREGYGLASYRGAMPIFDGNTFMGNRHAITAHGDATSSYVATNNLVLTSAPKEKWGSPEQDFDVHGTWNCLGVDHGCGIAGKEFMVRRNTFLGTDRPNLRVRGIPCTLATFRENVSRETKNDAVKQRITLSQRNDPRHLLVEDDAFNSPDPTEHLAAGDFDADGRDDLFLATGAAWYWSPHAKAEWRLLGRNTDALDALRFGDFDGDGRTDVFRADARGFWVSWGGASAWEKLSDLVAPIADLLVADFDGDGIADVLWTTGTEWQLSVHGRFAFAPWARSSHRAPRLRVGDFDADGASDVFGVVEGDWVYVPGRGQHVWKRLQPAPTALLDDLVVADVDGDGRADVVFGPRPTAWQISFGGTADLAPMVSTLGPLEEAVFGRFDDAPGADAAWLDDTRWIDLVSDGARLFRLYSENEMR